MIQRPLFDNCYVVLTASSKNSIQTTVDQCMIKNLTFVEVLSNPRLMFKLYIL